MKKSKFTLMDLMDEFSRVILCPIFLFSGNWRDGMMADINRERERERERGREGERAIGC